MKVFINAIVSAVFLILLATQAHALNRLDLEVSGESVSYHLTISDSRFSYRDAQGLDEFPINECLKPNIRLFLAQYEESKSDPMAGVLTPSKNHQNPEMLTVIENGKEMTVTPHTLYWNFLSEMLSQVTQLKLIEVRKCKL